ncbi:MAG: type II toxin-antitoxin system RelE/ParE family toxin [Candidatus Protochlamydia sp.]|nr:type II toxin-antitoxin system RelE/ParE family toxin [Candidatus Protochlamydia sp.]
MEYSVEIIPQVIKCLQEIEPIFAKKIRERIRFLVINPHPGSIKLSGYESSYLTRVGKYRITYKYDEKVLISVVNLDHRKNIYR